MALSHQLIKTHIIIILANLLFLPFMPMLKVSKDSPAHINKNTYFGQIHKIDDMKSPENPECESIKDDIQHVFNLTTATPEIMKNDKFSHKI